MPETIEERRIRQAKYRREVWYPKNKEIHKQKTNITKQKRRPVLYGKVNDLKAERGCIDCGNKDPRVLDFDHVRGEKEFSIAVGVFNLKSWENIEAEIEKCDIRCANCHRIKTHERRREAGPFKWLPKTSRPEI